MIRIHPYPNKFKSFHFKLEYHVCLTCLHPNRENKHHAPTLESTPRLCPLQLQRVIAVAQLALRLALQIALIPYLAGALGIRAKHWLHYPKADAVTGAVAGVPIEAAAPNLVPPTSRRALHSLTPTSQLSMVLNVLQVLYFNTLIFVIWV